jgi:hypothetical protein
MDIIAAFLFPSVITVKSRSDISKPLSTVIFFPEIFHEKADM